MTINRERVYADLFDKARDSSRFMTARRSDAPTNIAPADCPALFMLQKREQPRDPDAGWLLHIEFQICVFSPDENVEAATILNPLVDALVGALSGGPSIRGVSFSGNRSLGMASIEVEIKELS